MGLGKLNQAWNNLDMYLKEMAEVSSLHREPLITEKLGNSSEVDFT